jgi:hypothetical protein
MPYAIPTQVSSLKRGRVGLGMLLALPLAGLAAAPWHHTHTGWKPTAPACPAARAHQQVFETRREGTHAIPPACDAPIVVRDRGSCGPRFIRSTLNMVPQSSDILRGASLPLVAIICPLALQDPVDDAVEVGVLGGSEFLWVTDPRSAGGCSGSSWPSYQTRHPPALLRPRVPLAGGGLHHQRPDALLFLQGLRQPVHALGGGRARYAVRLLRRIHRGAP